MTRILALGRLLSLLGVAGLAACTATTSEPSANAIAVAGPSLLGDAPPSGRDPSTLPPTLPRRVDAPAVGGTTEPVVIDTRRFANQIDRRVHRGATPRPARFLPRHQKPRLPEARGDHGHRFGDVRNVARGTPEVGFPGIAQTPWSPPDPSIAVGPNHVVATVNMKIAWYKKDGTPQFEQFLDSSGEPGFFEEVGAGGFTFDPKCFYDPHAGRYVVLALEYYSGKGESWITIAVSDDDDPNGLWFKYRTWSLVSADGSEYWVDYPGLGYDERGWYVTGNLFRLGGGPGPGFLGGLFRVFDKTGPLAGETATWSDVLAGGASWQVTQAPQAGDKARIVRQWSADALEIGLIEGEPDAPSLDRAVVGVPRVDGDNTATTPIGAGLWIVDPRMMNATIRDGILWCTNHGRVEGDSVASGVWYAIDCNPASPTFLQAGALRAGAPGESFFPAVAVNGAGAVGIGYGRSGPERHPTLEIAGRLPSDPPGTMSAGIEIGASVTSPTNGDDLSRWGDYFDMTVDPVDDATFWFVGELQTPDGWVTEIHAFTVGIPADLDGNGTVDGADFGLLLAAFGTPGGPADLDGSGTVDGADIGLLLTEWSR